MIYFVQGSTNILSSVFNKFFSKIGDYSFCLETYDRNDCLIFHHGILSFIQLKINNLSVEQQSVYLAVGLQYCGVWVCCQIPVIGDCIVIYTHQL